MSLTYAPLGSVPAQPLFQLGQVVCTQGVIAHVPQATVFSAIKRHWSGDWGCVGAEDSATNNAALKSGQRLLSAYPIDPDKPCKGHGDNCLWIITEADRSVTTLLLPEEY